MGRANQDTQLQERHSRLPLGLDRLLVWFLSIPSAWLHCHYGSYTVLYVELGQGKIILAAAFIYVRGYKARLFGPFASGFSVPLGTR